MKTEKNRQLVIALSIYLAFTLLIGAANALNYVGERDGTVETLEPIAGMLMGFVAFPIFCIGLPLWLARRWGLEFSFWSRRKSWVLSVVIIVLYVLLTQERSLGQIAAMTISPFDFFIHFVSSSLFHISYYPLFAVLLLPVIRKNFGLTAGLVVTAALFALYHLASFYYFPAGLTLQLQVFLFASFLVNLLLYLWTENLILVALVHTIGGSVGLAVNGALFNQVDELLIITAIIMIGLFAYMITYEIRHRERPYRAGWWLQTEVKEQ
ncbi:MAG: CPBP family intramembrane metalloprotease [Chloroflexi bacterium]|nr:CPBP family intramembrane metalloprotease [Chloroflexota bacterium]